MIPDAALSQHIAIVGKTGSGKTFAAKGLVERFLDAGERVCMIDPTGVYWGLRLLADATSPGYGVVIFGGRHADIPLSGEHGEAIAEIVAGSSTPAIIDTSLMTVGERTRFFADFADALLRKNRGALHLVIDEAHLFAPQGRVADPQSGKMLHAANNLVSLGRARRISVILISQRPAKLHKDSLTQAEALVALRLIAPQDRKAIEAWIDDWADKDQGREVIASLPSLPRGEGWVWAPEAGTLARVRFPRIKTFDSSSGLAEADDEVTLGPIDVSAIRERLAIAEAPSEAGEKIDKAKRLRARIAELEREVDALRKRDGERAEMERQLRSAIKAAAAYLAPLAVEVVDGVREMDVRPPPEPPTIEHESTSKYIPAPRPPSPSKGERRGGGAELRILRVLAERHPGRLSDAQWATLAGMKRTGGTWTTYRSRLRSAAYIDLDGGKLFGVTDAGFAAIGGKPSVPASPAEVIAMWRRAVGSGPSKLLDALIEVYPQPMDRANLADRTRMTATGGTFMTYLSRLRSNGLVEEAGRRVKVSPTLMGDLAG